MSRPRLHASKNSLKNLIKQLELAFDKGFKQSDAQVQLLLLRIKELVGRLRGELKGRELRRILGSFGVLCGLVVGTQVSAQNFKQPINDPFGLMPNPSFASPTLGDIDGDGDLDLLTGEVDTLSSYYLGGLFFYENTGTVNSPQFNFVSKNPFGLNTDTLGSEIIIPRFGDIDGDGDLDILVGGTGFYGIAMFENTGTAQAPVFGLPTEMPFGINDTTYAAFAEPIDIDDDGDLDLLIGGYYGNFSFYENTGTATQPSFGNVQKNPFGLTQTYDWSFVTAGDVDWDGDIDLFVGEYYGDMLYFQNTGSKTSPMFAAPVPNPNNIQNASYFGFPVLADLDGDSDADLLVNQYYGYYGSGSAFVYYENAATGIGISEFEAGLEVYPNVVQDIVKINTEEELTDLWITDISGKTVQVINPDLRQLDLSKLAPGAYHLHLVNQNSVEHIEKLIKN